MVVALEISGGDSWLYSFCKAISIASFRVALVNKLFTSRDIMVSSGSRAMFLIDSLASLVLISMLAPSILSKNFASVLLGLSYELPGKVSTGHSGVSALCTLAKPYIGAGCPPVDLILENN